MNRALQIAHLALLIAATALIGAAAWRGILLAWDIDALVNSTNATLAHINGNTGTIAMLDEDLGAAKSAVIHADLIARHEQQQLTTLDAQERQVFADLHATMSATDATLASLQETSHSATTTLATANATISGLRPLESAAASAVSHLDSVIADPAIPDTLGNTAKITSDAARITKDAADEADKLAHPPKVKLGFWAGVWAAAKYVHQFEPPLF